MATENTSGRYTVPTFETVADVLRTPQEPYGIFPMTESFVLALQLTALPFLSAWRVRRVLTTSFKRVRFGHYPFSVTPFLLYVRRLGPRRRAPTRTGLNGHRLSCYVRSYWVPIKLQT
jgi:hypothetical protein